jgi:invasion protein IalB
MGLFVNKLSARKFGGAARCLAIAGASLLCLLVLNTGAMTQTAQTKTKTSGQPPATPKQPAPGEAAPARPTWAVNCSNAEKGLDCRVIQSLFLKNTGQRLLSVVVHVPAETKKPEMLLQLPLGIYLPPGVTLQIGKDASKAIAYKNCDRFGCLAEYAVTEAEITAMSKGSDLTITMQNLKQEPITVTVPVLGFAPAYAKIK